MPIDRKHLHGLTVVMNLDPGTIRSVRQTIYKSAHFTYMGGLARV